jgi:uncharacterized protein YjbI with pentapeptide repeats
MPRKRPQVLGVDLNCSESRIAETMLLSRYAQGDWDGGMCPTITTRPSAVIVLHSASVRDINAWHNLTMRMQNLSEADLTGGHLGGADLYEANLSGANLSGVRKIAERFGVGASAPMAHFFAR